MKFYVCKHCGNIVTHLTDSGAPMTCCGEVMQLLEAGVVEAAVEKHIPVVTVEGSAVRVAVGAVAHPMTQEHSIQWIVLETENGASLHHLTPADAPEAVFALVPGDKVKAAYEYCNIHGLWKVEL